MTDEFSVESVYAELLGRAPENKMEPRLAPLFRAMDVLGEPNKAYPIIHITGTNGKTSTARMIEAGLRAHGLSTGRYTSPHLSKVTERISLDGAPVSDETFVRIWDEIRPYLQIVDDELTAEGQPRLTYFECLTILAFAVFADQPVNVAIMEVGLGRSTHTSQLRQQQVWVVWRGNLNHPHVLPDPTEEITK
jgi:dihydrofolate synthase/folylpolyglutamate synthase